MITGYNTEVKYGNLTFHIQTEDRGKKASRIDTIIYKSGGAIVHRKIINYKDISKCDCLEQVVKEIMIDVHHQTIREVRRGLWLLPPDRIPSPLFSEKMMRFLTE